MPKTARQYFDQDISRAQFLIKHARSLPANTPTESLLQQDILRSGWMMAVGAMDAYLCDAYTDLLALTLRAKKIQPSVKLDPRIAKRELPVETFLMPYRVRANWQFRMAARNLMARADMLELRRIRDSFRPFFKEECNLLQSKAIKLWIQSTDNTDRRLFGVSFEDYATMPKEAQNKAVQAANKIFEKRFHTIVQRRHDCIHNCDRPKSKLQSIGGLHVKRVADDIQFLITSCDKYIEAEFRSGLEGMGCTSVTINRIGYS